MDKEKKKKSWLDDYKDVNDFFGQNPNSKRIESKNNPSPDSKVSVWRDVDSTGKIYPIFVKPLEIKAKDLIFCEGKDFEGYCYVESFKQNAEGRIDNFQLVPAHFDIDKENTMLRVVEKMVMAAQENSDKQLNIIVCLKQI